MSDPEYFHVPVSGEEIGDHFGKLVPDERKPVPLSLGEAAQVADEINTAVEVDRSAVWGNTLTDVRGFRIHGHPVELGGRAVVLVGGEIAVFPRT